MDVLCLLTLSVQSAYRPDQTIAFDLGGLPYIHTDYRGSDNEQECLDQDNTPDFLCDKHSSDIGMGSD